MFVFAYIKTNGFNLIYQNFIIFFKVVYSYCLIYKKVVFVLLKQTTAICEKRLALYMFFLLSNVTQTYHSI